MHDPLLVRGLERVSDLAGDLQRLRYRKAYARCPTEVTRSLDAGAGDQLRQRLAFDELEYQGGAAVHVFEAVDRTDVRMIESSEHAGFTLEAGDPVRVPRVKSRQDLDRDVAFQLRIARAVHLSH